MSVESRGAQEERGGGAHCFLSGNALRAVGREASSPHLAAERNTAAWRGPRACKRSTRPPSPSQRVGCGRPSWEGQQHGWVTARSARQTLKLRAPPAPLQNARTSLLNALVSNATLASALASYQVGQLPAIRFGSCVEQRGLRSRQLPGRTAARWRQRRSQPCKLWGCSLLWGPTHAPLPRH